MVTAGLPLVPKRGEIIRVKTPQRSLSGTMLILAASAGTMTTSTIADTFGTGADTFTMDFVNIGNPGNVADTTGVGGVSYTYRMGTYEVSEDMVAKANALGNLGITIPFPLGANKPAAGLSWYQAATFVNWLNTSTGHAPAYNFDGNGNFSNWSPADAWILGGQNLYRNKDAQYFLPSDNEWYKAAFYDGTKYSKYATGSDTIPDAVAGGTTAGTAVYNQQYGTATADVQNAGGLSPYGTMAQAGNVWELVETPTPGPRDTEWRQFYGGSHYSEADSIGWSGSSLEPDGGYDPTIGFRVAAVPEPQQYAVAFGVVLFGGGVWLRRNKVQGVAAN